MIASLAYDFLGTWQQALILLVGVAHAVAAFGYFSKARHGAVWAAAWIVLTLTVVALLPVVPAIAYGLIAGPVCLWTAWWAMIRPSTTRDWVAENAHQATAAVGGGILTVSNLRNFEWRGRRDIVEHWETRHFDLAKLEAIDLFSCYWAGPHMAHMILSFSFTDGVPLAFSIETRREKSESWSTAAGFFKAYELIIVAADERDVVRVRSVVRGEHLERYRIIATPEIRRKLLDRYVLDMNALAVRPRFYHTIWTNCTTEIARLVRMTGTRAPIDWRILLSGHVPAYLYRAGLIDTKLTFAETKAAASIDAVARAADTADDFSRRIRGETAVSVGRSAAEIAATAREGQFHA